VGLAGSELPVGTEFAGYRITGVIGRGGMSIVYSAEHMRLGRPAALKVLSPMLAADEGFRSRFTRESQLAAGLDHPSIVAIYDAGETDGLLYIAMRLVRGDDLGGLLEREGPLSFARAFSIVEQIGGALDHAHTQGLIHRDVKPANILVERPSERAYLSDFGVVKETSSRGLTKTGFFLGTFEYAAPEQIEGREVDGRTDVYALGCVLYESLTAEAPFAAQTEGSVIHAHLVEPPPRATEKRPDLPTVVNDVIATAMAKAQENRYPTCGELVRALRAAVGHGDAVATESDPAGVQGAAATVFATSPGTAAPALPADPDPVAQPDEVSAPASEPPGVPASAAAKEQRTMAITRGRIVAAAAILVAVIAAAVAAALLIGGNDSSTSSNPPTVPSTSTSTSPSTSTSVDVAVGLQGVVPETLMKHCKVASPNNGASQTSECAAPAGTTTFWPDTWSFSLYPSTSAALHAYDALRVQSGIGSNFGRCDRTSWSGEGAWLHNPEAGAPPKPGGRRFCYFQGNVAVIVWLHEKLAQPNHIDMIGTARASGSDHFNLYSWYSFWHHTVGKCLAPGCVARLS
jgi:serine/threonine protein kinase